MNFPADPWSFRTSLYGLPYWGELYIHVNRLLFMSFPELPLNDKSKSYCIGFSADLQTCHTTNPGWQPATFSHTNFPLTLGHAGRNCTDCHAGGNYSSTPTDCYSCHQADYNNTNNPNHKTLSFQLIAHNAIRQIRDGSRQLILSTTASFSRYIPEGTGDNGHYAANVIPIRPAMHYSTAFPAMAMPIVVRAILMHNVIVAIQPETQIRNYKRVILCMQQIYRSYKKKEDDFKQENLSD